MFLCFLAYFNQIECVFEYILDTEIVQIETELFAKYSSGKYKILRRIVRNDEIKNLRIHKIELKKYYLEKLENEDEANKKTEKCFSKNEKALEENGNYFSMQKLFNLNENQIFLNDEWAGKFGEKIKIILILKIIQLSIMLIMQRWNPKMKFHLFYSLKYYLFFI